MLDQELSLSKSTDCFCSVPETVRTQKYFLNGTFPKLLEKYRLDYFVGKSVKLILLFLNR